MSGLIRFVVLAAPRTGSNWLCTLLDSHPDILCHHEIFNPTGIKVALSTRENGLKFGTLEERNQHPLEVLDRIWAHSQEHRAVGFKINIGQDAAVLEDVLADRGIRKIVIRRTNRLRSFISECIAEVTEEWESYPWQELHGPAHQIHLDIKKLWQQLERNRKFYAGVRDSLHTSGQSAFEIDYESLNDHSRLEALLGFLDMDPAVELIASTRKQNREEIGELIDNIDEVRAAIKGTELEQDLDAPGTNLSGGGTGY